MSVLIPVKTRVLMEDISRELKVFFPSVTFRLSSLQKETRTCITIGYSDGPSGTRVRNITRQFAHSYPSAGESVRVYINIERQMSTLVENQLLGEMKSVWKIKGRLEAGEYCQHVGCTAREYIKKIFDMRDFNG